MRHYGSDGSDDSENSNYLKCQPNFGYFFVWCHVQYFIKLAIISVKKKDSNDVSDSYNLAIS